MCNLCSFKFIKKQAKKDGFKVTTMPGFMNGIDVFVHPFNVDVKSLEGISEPDHPNRDKYFKAWFMEIPGCHVD